MIVSFKFLCVVSIIFLGSQVPLGPFSASMKDLVTTLVTLIIYHHFEKDITKITYTPRLI